jgi:hypothetical protein
VFGRPDAAAAGKLIQVVSGDRGAQEKVKPLFDVSARAVLNTGAEVYKGESLRAAGMASRLDHAGCSLGGRSWLSLCCLQLCS